MGCLGQITCQLMCLMIDLIAFQWALHHVFRDNLMKEPFATVLT